MKLLRLTRVKLLWNLINERIALRVTLAVSTMSCFYLFLCWSLLPIFIPKLENFVFYVSGGILQLIFLPLIMVGQNVQSRAYEKRAAQDHAAVMEMVDHVRSILQLLQASNGDTSTIKKEIATIEQQMSVGKSFWYSR